MGSGDEVGWMKLGQRLQKAQHLAGVVQVGVDVLCQGSQGSSNLGVDQAKYGDDAASQCLLHVPLAQQGLRACIIITAAS